MRKSLFYALFSATFFLITMPVHAQDQSVGEAMASDSEAVSSSEAAPSAGPVCELHVFPTENYLGINSGLLSGFGLIGAVADQAAHKNRVLTVKELMEDYLGPDIQIAELEKLDYVKVLGLDGYQVVIEPPTPSSDDLKGNPELKAKVKATNKDIKDGKRLTASTNPCYAEFLITNIFYHKAMMYGSNLFVGTMLRDFSSGAAQPVTSAGAVKNPLEEFPPKSPEMIDTAKAELRDAFAKDFIEWSEKKLKKAE